MNKIIKFIFMFTPEAVRLFLSKHFVRSKKYRHFIKALAQLKSFKYST